MPPAEVPAEFVKFVSSVKGCLVQRYGSPNYVGAVRTPQGIEWLPAQVVGLTEAELVRYGREYKNALRDGALKERTAEDFLAQIEEETAAQAKAEAEAKAKAKKATTTKES